jgi:hypothetical protein
VYLLMADCDNPRISAACFSFISYFSTMALAMRDLIAGKTVLTPISHGISKMFTNYANLGGNVYKYDARHMFL